MSTPPTEPTEPTDEDLAKLYGAAAPHAEHQRGDVIVYASTRTGQPRRGIILWISARFGDIPLEYVTAPDDGDFVEYVYPSEVIIVTEGG